MADGIIQVAPDSTGKKVDTSELTVGSNTVERQRVVVADPTTAANFQAVSAQGGASVNPAAPPAATTGTITSTSTTIGPITLGVYDGVTIAINGVYSGVNFGFWASNDNSLYYPVVAVRMDTGVAETTTGVISSTTRSWEVDTGGAEYFKIVSTAWSSWTSGTINILPQAFSSDPCVSTYPQGLVASGIAPISNPVLVAGWDATLARTIKTDTSGNVGVRLTDATNFMPTMDAAARRGYVQLTDGTSAQAVKASGTAPATTDLAAVVALSPNIGPAITTNAAQACTTKMLSAIGSATNVKASAGNLMGFAVQNQNAAVVWIEFFDAASVTLGTTAPVAAFPMAASSTLVIPVGQFALYNHATQIFVAAVTTYNGSTPGSISGTVFYK